MRYSEIERLSIVSTDSEDEEDNFDSKSNENSEPNKMQIAIHKIKTGWVEDNVAEMLQIHAVEKEQKLVKLNEELEHYNLIQ
jgi:hypothetical protein